jgi:LysM repeat protein
MKRLGPLCLILALTLGPAWAAGPEEGSSPNFASPVPAGRTSLAAPSTEPGPFLTGRGVPIFQLPDKIELCGEPVPLHDQAVYEMLDREFHLAVYDPAQVILWMKRANRYFPEITKSLAKAGLPDDIKYLAVAESGLKTWVWSPAGAAGFWQFIKPTGRRYGLEKNSHKDERLDVEASTSAALNYLKDLYGIFKSWPLAMAAYNCGEERVKREIREQGVSDYYNLNLPLETERYIFRVLAAKIVLSNPKAYGYDPARIKLYPPYETRTVAIRLKRPLHLREVAQAAKTTFRVVKELNPSLQGYYLPSGLHWLRLPAEGTEDFEARLASAEASAPAVALPEPPEARRAAKPAEDPRKIKKPAPPKAAPEPAKASRQYTVAAGDTLGEVAKKLKVSVEHLRKANKLEGNTIKVGQVLSY